ncbi:MAG: hypothetical protein V4534_08920 [Myxococcota bacterium]
MFSVVGSANIRSDLVKPLTELLELGPNHWVKLPTNPTGKYIYQRGLSGGTLEALTLLFGQMESTPRTVSFVAGMHLSDIFAKSVSAWYGRPLIIRGRTDSFDKTTYYTDIENTDLPKLLQDINFNKGKFNSIGSRAGEIQQISTGNTIETVESIGMFLGKAHEDFPDWALGYVYFFDTMLNLGIRPKIDSRGYALYQDLVRAGANAEQLIAIFRKLVGCISSVTLDAIAPASMHVLINHSNDSGKCCVSIKGQSFSECQTQELIEKLLQENAPLFSAEEISDYELCSSIAKKDPTTQGGRYFYSYVSYGEEPGAHFYSASDIGKPRCNIKASGSARSFSLSRDQDL